MNERYRLEKELEWNDAQQDRLEFECSLYRLDDGKHGPEFVPLEEWVPIFEQYEKNRMRCKDGRRI